MNDNPQITRRDFVRMASTGAAGALLIGCESGARRDTPAAVSREPVTAEPPPPDTKDWRVLADEALSRIRRCGAEYGDVRLLRSTTQVVRGEDGRIAGVSDRVSRGFGVRVLYHGAWGFASSALVHGAEVRRVADLACAIAKASAALVSDPVKLVPEPPHIARVATPFQLNPLEVPLDQRAALLLDSMSVIHAQEGISRSSGRIWMQRDEKFFASTEGARIDFDLLAINAELRATAALEGRFASRAFHTPYLRTGYELIRDSDLVSQAERIAAQAVEKAQAPTIDPGKYDLLLDPEHLSLTIHESCGHPSELDRALGYEANYAGTSFLTPDKLGSFRYGSPVVNLIADNTEPGTLAATGYDDDGVECQRWHIVREGVFSGYCTNREVAGKIGETRSRGSCRADSWANVPIVRIANVGLAPGDGRLDDMIADIRRGILIEGHDSFSIDQKRYNFQFGGDAFWMIENGKRTHMLRDVIYAGITPEFWSRCDAVADAMHRRTYGFITCGKGQPGQSGWMTHAASHARFRDIDVIRGATAQT
ncbi:MAG: TldD/PmbA family protein [Phycisphaerales bacterium]|nr:TldD/PmbA family protein [Phycisphaerales bacterium]